MSRNVIEVPAKFHLANLLELGLSDLCVRARACDPNYLVAKWDLLKD